MKRTYLIFTIIGFILPGYFLWKVTFEDGNFLFWSNPSLTFSQTFVNDYSIAFFVDLLVIVYLFMFMSYKETKKLGMKKGTLFFCWVWTFIFGLASGAPLFLYLREAFKEKNNL